MSSGGAIDDRRRAKLASALALITAAGLFAVAFVHYSRGGIPAAVISAAAGVLCVALSRLESRLGPDLRANLLVFVMWVLMTLATLMRGGLGTPPSMAMASLPMIGLLITTRRAAIVWACVVAATFATLAVVEQRGFLVPDMVATSRRIWTNAAAGVVFLGMLLGIGLEYERRKAAALHHIAQRDEQLRAAERARNEAEAEARMMRAEHLASLGQLAAGAAHEINNPLAYVLANLAALGKRQARGDRLDDVESREALHDAVLGAKSIQRIVADLKTYSRSDEEELSPIDVHAVVDDTLKMARNELRHRARVALHIEPGMHVLANRTRLGQILLNLLINAAQATPDGAADRHTITVTAGREGELAVIEVRDTGAGIPAEILGRVTEPFFTTKPVGVGTGLGLSAVVNLTKRLGGTFELESEVGVGTAARMRLPVAEVLAVERHSTMPVPASSERARVLVVDDDALVARALRRILADHQVETVSSGAEALALFAGDADYDLILCDMMMPEMTGEQLHRQLEIHHPALADRVAFISGGAFSDDARAFLDAWTGAIIAKPFAERQLHELVIASVARRRASRAG